MSSFVQRIFANIWSFILTLVRSLLALFSFRRRSADPYTLPSVNRTPNDALARAHSHLRPILLTPRSISRSPTQRVQNTRSRSDTSTLFPGHDENATAYVSAPLPSGPQRTSPKLDPGTAELGLSVAVVTQAGPPGTSATSSREGTPDISLPTTHTASMCALPLTPPDRCYLAPMPSASDCPYTEPWPANVVNRGKPRLPGSPLKVSINTDTAFTEPMVALTSYPPPGHWNDEQIWTSTPYKTEDPIPEPALSLFDHPTASPMDPALANISHALISRSRSSIQPYDDAANSSLSSDASPGLYPNGPPAGHRARSQVLRPMNQPFAQFHHPDAYAWRRHGVRLPGKAHTHAYTRSRSHMDLPVSEWYDADAYVPSPVSALSPPRCDSATDDEDEDEVPLYRLRERLARRTATVGLGVPLGTRKDAMSPRSRRMSEGCLLVLSETTPTRVGLGARAGRNVLSLALDGDGSNPKDWLEALSLRFPSEQTDGMAPVPEPHAGVSSEVAC